MFTGCWFILAYFVAETVFMLINSGYFARTGLNPFFHKKVNWRRWNPITFSWPIYSLRTFAKRFITFVRKPWKTFYEQNSRPTLSKHGVYALKHWLAKQQRIAISLLCNLMSECCLLLLAYGRFNDAIFAYNEVVYIHVSLNVHRPVPSNNFSVLQQFQISHFCLETNTPDLLFTLRERERSPTDNQGDAIT